MLWFSLVNVPVKTINKLKVASSELRVAASCDLIVESCKSSFEVRVIEN